MEYGHNIHFIFFKSRLEHIFSSSKEFSDRNPIFQELEFFSSCRLVQHVCKVDSVIGRVFFGLTEVVGIQWILGVVHIVGT